MKLEGSHTFNAPRDEVWEALLDPDVLRSALPGCEELKQVGENEYEATLNVRVGPVQGRFKGGVRLSELNPPESYRISVDGQGAPGFVKGEGAVTLEEDAGTTVMHYSGEGQVGGRLASVGQRLLDSTAKSLTRQGLESVDNRIQSQQAAETTGEPAPAPSTPTQSQVAATVAKDVAQDLVPSERRPLWIGALVVLAILVLYRRRR